MQSMEQNKETGVPAAIFHPTEPESLLVGIQQVTAHALVRLWATQALHAVQDWVVGRPLYLVDFHCFAIPQRCATQALNGCPPACACAAACGILTKT